MLSHLLSYADQFPWSSLSRAGDHMNFLLFLGLHKVMCMTSRRASKCIASRCKQYGKLEVGCEFVNRLVSGD